MTLVWLRLCRWNIPSLTKTSAWRRDTVLSCKTMSQSCRRPISIGLLPTVYNACGWVWCNSHCLLRVWLVIPYLTYITKKLWKHYSLNKTKYAIGEVMRISCSVRSKIEVGTYQQRVDARRGKRDIVSNYVLKNYGTRIARTSSWAQSNDYTDKYIKIRSIRVIRVPFKTLERLKHIIYDYPGRGYYQGHSDS